MKNSENCVKVAVKSVCLDGDAIEVKRRFFDTVNTEKEYGQATLTRNAVSPDGVREDTADSVSEKYKSGLIPVSEYIFED